MTEIKKATKKVATKKDDQVEEVVQTEKETPKTPEVKKAEKKKISMDDRIEVMNNTTGRYKYVSRVTGYTLEMDEYGDVESIPFSELRTMSSGQKAHIREAFIVILDEDAVNELGYSKLYENVFSVEGVNALLHGRDYDKLEKVIPKMPKYMQETLASVAKRKFKTRELSDLNVRDILEKTLNVKIDV